MRLPSQIIADRFHLQLTDDWVQWFDVVANEFSLPGCFRYAVDVNGLCGAKPTQIWPGFMLPDTLPLLGNGYGDWISVRINERDQPGELVHWYHGGGDWVPVGNHIAEAVVHDMVDLFRPVRKQMLRGAVESLRPSSSIGNLSESLKGWLNQSFNSIASCQPASLDQVLKLLTAGDYVGALQVLIDCGLAAEAATCDLIEYIIQQAVPSEHGSLHMMTEVDCDRIESLCHSVIQRRQDLGWSYALLAWCQNANQQKELSRETYFAGRHASAFSDQSVRLRLHKFDQRYGKFSIAQLVNNKASLPPVMKEDGYLQLFLSNRSGSSADQVEEFWLSEARRAIQEGDYATGYRHSYNAGWDIGAGSMAGYRKALESLHETACSAGWSARAAVAKAHLDCL